MLGNLNGFLFNSGGHVGKIKRISLVMFGKLKRICYFLEIIERFSFLVGSCWEK